MSLSHVFHVQVAASSGEHFLSSTRQLSFFSSGFRMIHFKRSDSDIYDLPHSTSASAGHALIQLFKRRRQNANGEPFAVLGSRQPHYIHIRTSGAYTHYLGAELDGPARARTTSHVSALAEDSASEYSCDSAETDVRPSQSIDFTVIWDPETGFSVYGSDSGNHHPGGTNSVPETLQRQANHLPEKEDVQKKPLPRVPSGISEECHGLVSQFPGETDSEKESFYGASDDSGHPDCEPHLPSRFSMTTICSFLQPNDKTTRPPGKTRTHDILHRLRQHSSHSSHSYHDVPSFLQPQKRVLMRSKASRQFSSHFPIKRRRVTDISEEHWVLLDFNPRVSECLVSSD